MYTEQEMELIKLIDALQVSTEEYKVLGDILSSEFMCKYLAENARMWLYPQNIDSRVIIRSQIESMKIPYEDLPMHINEKRLIIGIIVLWRLKIGR